MSSYKISELHKVTSGRLIGNGNYMVRHLITDSRNTGINPGSVFVAIRGRRHDGHEYIEDLYFKRKMSCFIVEYLPESLKDAEDVSFLVVPDSLKALQQIASWHRQHFIIPIIGITGSNGKTIVKEWLSELLHQHKNVVRSPKSYNSQIGVPLSVWLLESTTDIGIFEAGISFPGEMETLEQIIKPSIGVITNIGEAHQENFSSISEKIHEKMKLFQHSQVLIYCRDYELIHKEAQKLSNPKLISWSTKQKADLRINEIIKSSDSTIITGLYNDRIIQTIIPYIDDASVENAIHCWLLMLYLGFSNDVIRMGLSRLNPVAMRLELKKGINNCTLINDSYNSDINSLSIALDFLNQQQQHPGKTLILSDIQQSGKDADTLYSEVATLIKNKNIQQLIGIGPALMGHSKFFKGKAIFYKSTDDFILNHPRHMLSNEAILLKGSRQYAFERISAMLEQKVHHTIMEINLNAMIHNLNYFHSKLKPSTKIIAMVKAFSYGSGTYEIANMLQYQKVSYLAVAFADEGVMLREAGITMPIMVMNPEEGTFPLLIEHKLEPEIYGFRELQLLTDALKTARIYQFPVHVKLDTGMHRLGFMDHELPGLIAELKCNEQVRVATVFSHLAASDEPEHDAFTNQQISTFDIMSKKLTQSLSYPVLRHILNSSGIERFTHAQFDMVRLGIGLYGIGTLHNQAQLQNVSTLKSCILQIKKIPAKETVGYSRKFLSEKDTLIGIVPIGYADGLNRRLGNGATQFWVNGKLAPVIGNICMDMCMIDLTGIEAQEGSEVEIFGNHIPVSSFAEKMGTIPYEALTSVSSRVKRIYYQE